MSFKVPEHYRVIAGPGASSPEIGNNGAFNFALKNGHPVFVIASDGGGWEHVSVSMRARCPTWEEMCFVKDLFWGPEDTVVQFHPPKSDYVNNHKYCLHLWRQVGVEIARPPRWMVGLK